MAKGAKKSVRPFAPWRIVVWLIMFLAAGGFVINGYYTVLVAQAVGTLTAEAAANGPNPYIALGWAVTYTLASFLLMATALSTLRWAEWARRVLRVAALVLLAWAAYTGYVMYGQWQQLGVVLGQPGLPPDLLAPARHQQSIMLVVLVMKAISVPLLAWLSWILGSASVRQQFSRTTS